jgi:hypothetical protein
MDCQTTWTKTFTWHQCALLCSAKPHCLAVTWQRFPITLIKSNVHLVRFVDVVLNILVRLEPTGLLLACQIQDAVALATQVSVVFFVLFKE